MKHRELEFTPQEGETLKASMPGTGKITSFLAMITSHGKVPGNEGWLELGNEGSRFQHASQALRRDGGEATSGSMAVRAERDTREVQSLRPGD